MSGTSPGKKRDDSRQPEFAVESWENQHEKLGQNFVRNKQRLTNLSKMLNEFARTVRPLQSCRRY
jgi:hypothetical protein